MPTRWLFEIHKEEENMGTLQLSWNWWSTLLYLPRNETTLTTQEYTPRFQWIPQWNTNTSFIYIMKKDRENMKMWGQCTRPSRIRLSTPSKTGTSINWRINTPDSLESHDDMSSRIFSIDIGGSWPHTSNPTIKKITIRLHRPYQLTINSSASMAASSTRTSTRRRILQHK